MIPVLLNVRNFMCYTDVHEPLRFDGIHVAVLSGDNGHGKSALLDAITWALWGRARARSDDELIHTGATEMEVEFEFLLDDQQYRVIRKRQRRGKTSSADLQFAVLNGGGYRPLTERSVAETERLIKRTLRMGYETFASSSFIQQGRADNFTTTTPGERKRILAEILELGYYDELEERAKKAFDVRETRLWEERRVAREWEQEIARRPEHQAEADRLQVELEASGRCIAELGAACNTARERVARLESAARDLAEAGERLERYLAEQQRGADQLAERRKRLAETQAVLGRADVVEAAARELAEVCAALAEADARLQAYLPLMTERERAAAAVETERARLEVELAARRRQLGELAEAVAQGRRAEVELRSAMVMLDSVARLQKRQQWLQQTTTAERETVAHNRASNAHLKEEMHELRQRMDGLVNLAICPECERPIDAAHSQRLRRTLQARGVQLRERFRAQEKACLELEESIKQHEAEHRKLEVQLASREEAQRRLAQLESATQRGHEARQREAAVCQEVAAIERALAEHDYAAEERAALATLDARIAELGYDAQAHGQLRQRAAELAGAEREHQRLEQARVSAEHLATQVAELQAALERVGAECAAEEARCARLRDEAAALEDERQRLEALEGQLRQAQAQERELRIQHTLAVGRIEACDTLAGKLRESLTRQDQLMREHGVFGELVHAFGRKGVQAMIIETAIPEIEDEANRLLGRMTEGRMHVKLETQREARTGGTIETLDIKIGDELGTRSYELFSGGEGFRVNFALRIALSRLLAQRAGTRLQTLVIDEGFGSQDQQGRDRIVEAIQAIQDEFAKILVITHLEDLRERFPVRIEVTKTPRGSTFALR
jgi:DNA repair protein SbcC/Rad50